MKYDVNKYKYFVAKKQDGTPYQVVAVSTYAGRTVRGVAKCDPRDNFSLENGKKLAAARCNLKVAEKRKARAMRKYNEASVAMQEQLRFLDRMDRYAQDANMEVCDAKAELAALIQSM